MEYPQHQRLDALAFHSEERGRGHFTFEPGPIPDNPKDFIPETDLDIRVASQCRLIMPNLTPTGYQFRGVDGFAAIRVDGYRMVAMESKSEGLFADDLIEKRVDDWVMVYVDQDHIPRDAKGEFVDRFTRP